MNASAVKPALPTGGVQPPKVGLGGPPAAVISPPTQASVSPPKPSPSVTNSPVKPPAPLTVGLNHAPNVPVQAQAPLSLVQEHRPPVSNVSQQQLRPEKKEYPFALSVAPPAGSKPTSNGVEGSPNKPVPPPTVALPTIEVKKPEENLSDKPNHTPEPAVKLPATTPPQVVAHVAPSLPQPPTAIPPVPPPAVPPVVPPSPAKHVAATANHTSSAAEAAVETKPPVLAPVIAEPVVAAPPPAAVVPPATSSPAAAAPVAAAPPSVEPPPPKPAAAEVAKVRAEATTKPEFKVATPPRNVKRKKEAKEATNDAKASTSDEDDRKSKRTRTRTQPYQSPNPELTFIAKTFKTLTKSPDDKLILFYKNEFLAVRNAEASFYICQAMQNIYKSSPRIRIRWLSLDKQDGKPVADVYTPDFYDLTDFDCILTNLEMKKMDKHRFQLPAEERERTQNILKRALDVEWGRTDKAPPVTEEHPDGLDLSLFRDESQLKKRKKGSKKGGKKPKTTSSDSESDEDDSEEEDSSESEEETKKDVKVVKRIETPARTPARGKAKPKEVASREVVKRAAQVSEREKRASTSKRRSEPSPAAAAPIAAAAPGRTARPPPEKRAKVAVKTPAKRVAEPVAETTTRAAKTRNVKVAAPAAKPAAAPSRGSKEREPRKSAAPPAPAAAKGGRKRPGKKA